MFLENVEIRVREVRFAGKNDFRDLQKISSMRSNRLDRLGLDEVGKKVGEGCK